MQNGFILILGVLLGSHLPATAQTRPRQVNPIQERTPSMVTLLAAAPAHLLLAGSLPIRPLEERPAGFNILPGAAYTPDHSLDRLSPVEVVKTPFVRQARVMFVQLWGGRLQLSGFESTRQMWNAAVGFSGSLGATGGYPGARVPRADRIYGLSLAFPLGRDAHTGHRVEGSRCLAWIWSAGHGGRH
jgi:hypothetical protein